ncbi:MAG: hypothetical protein J0L92_33190 [Deltaproteobacteria bacterium]|nr:hypothetical protein [Deltaproteobacteria bacterium]
MSPPIAPEARFAKHRLLAEIGARGQARLSAARFSIDEADEAARFAALLLERSGLVRDESGTPLVPLPSRANEPALAIADAAIRGAIAAMQRVREIVELPHAAAALRDVEDARR